MIIKSTEFKKRWSRLIATDKIRLLKYLEIFQFTLIFTILTVCVSVIWNKLIPCCKPIPKDTEYNLMFLLKNMFLLIIQTFFLILVVFYIRKIGLLFPSISTLYYSRFRGHTTLDYSMHIAVFVIIIELIPSYKYIIDNINLYFLGDEEA
jgi:hypothetical protein